MSVTITATVILAGAWSWLQQDLDRAVLLALEDLVGVGGLAERQLMRGEILDAEGIGFVFEQRHDVVDPAPHVGLAHPQLDLLVEEIHHGHWVSGAAVDAAERDRAAA